MSKPEIEIIEPNYEGLAKVIDSLKDLYQMNGITSSMIETCFKHLMQPPTILHNNPNGENLDIGGIRANEIKGDELRHLVWLRNRLVNHFGEDSREGYILRFDEIINKLRNNGK